MAFLLSPAPKGWRRLIPPLFRRLYRLDGRPVPYWRTIADRIKLMLRPSWENEYALILRDAATRSAYWRGRAINAEAKLANLRDSLADADAERDPPE